MVTLTLNLIYGFLKSAKLVEMTISLCTLQTIIMIFSTFLRFLRLPIRSRVRRPKLWVSTGFKSSSQKCQNMNCGGLKKNFGGIFLFISSSSSFQVGLECCIPDSSFQFIDLWAPWEDWKFWDWPQAKNSLVWRQGSVVKLALHFFLAANHRPPSAQVSGASAQDPNFSVVDVLFVSLLSNAGQSYMRNGL